MIHSYPDAETIPKVTREGMAVEAPARALVDSAGTVQPEQMEMALRQAIQRGLTTRNQVMHEAALRHKENTIKPMLEAI